MRPFIGCQIVPKRKSTGCSNGTRQKKGGRFLLCNFGSFSYEEETFSPLKDASGKGGFEEVQKITVLQARNKSRNTPRPRKTCFYHPLRQQNGNSSTRLSHNTTHEVWHTGKTTIRQCFMMQKHSSLPRASMHECCFTPYCRRPSPIFTDHHVTRVLVWSNAILRFVLTKRRKTRS